MSNGGGSGGGRAQEPRSSDLWGWQLIFERRTFIFLEAENSPMETNSTVWIWWCGSVVRLHAGRESPTRSVCACGLVQECVHGACRPGRPLVAVRPVGVCVVIVALVCMAHEAVCVHLCTPGCVCTLPTMLSKLGVPACVHSCGSL